MQTFDLVIVGAGSAGCVLANRLSADPGLSVLLIEAGGSDKHPFIRVPAASGKAIFNPRFNWMYMTAPDKTRKNEPEMWPAGKVLGGGSSINGMMFVRGHHDDYDQWDHMGAKGWSYKEVLPYFKKLETVERGASDFRGGDGPLAVSEVRAPSPLTDAWLQSAVNIGIPRSPDTNGKLAEGADAVQSSQQNGKRHNTSAAYLWPVKDRPNLTVWTDSMVSKVLFEGKRASGVVVHRNGEEFEVSAGRGVILSCGSIGTPKLLKLSGVGPAKELASHDIDVVLDAPQVGENLQEHPAIPMGHHVSIPSIGSRGNLILDAIKNLWHGMNFTLFGRGPLSCGVGHAQVFVKTSKEYSVPNVQIVMSPFSFVVDEQGPRLYDRPAIGVAVGLTHTEARGQVTLQSNDWQAPPRIDYPMLASDDDVRQLIAGGKLARKITRAQPFKEILLDDREPDDSVQSDEEWAQYVRQNAFPMYHPCGTCAMGEHASAVVDSELRVHRLDGLWVADASVFPRITAGNINATVIMVAEKAADHIRNQLENSHNRNVS